MSLVRERLDALANPSLSLVSFESLGESLGAKVRDRRLRAMVRAKKSQRRAAAAMALQWGKRTSAAKRAGELALLVADKDAAVREQALGSLASVSIRADNVSFPARTVKSVLKALKYKDDETRWMALNAMWRLVSGKNAKLSRVMRRTVAKLLDDPPDSKAFKSIAGHLETFFEKDAGLISLVLLDLKRIEDRWPYARTLKRARAANPKLSAKIVRKLARRRPELKPLAKTWLAR